MSDERPLDPRDAALLIAQTRSDNTVLVGGQAVHIWATYFGISFRLPALTSDIDYQGTKAEARRAAARLTYKHHLTVATMDDATPNAAVLTVEMDGYDRPITIDYLSSVLGLDPADVNESAAEFEIEGETVLVLHPLLLLQAKVWNLARLPSKRTPEGFEQARLAIEIAAAMLRSRIAEGAAQRELLAMAKQVVKFALTAPARQVRAEFDLDCIACLPKELFAPGALPQEFHDQYWPRKRRELNL